MRALPLSGEMFLPLDIPDLDAAAVDIVSNPSAPAAVDTAADALVTPVVQSFGYVAIARVNTIVQISYFLLLH